MNKTIQLIFIIVLLCNINTYSQNAEIDSLETLLANHPETDTIRINLLNDIAFKIRFYDMEKTIQYAINADSISEILDYKKGNAVSLKIQGVYYASLSDFDKALTCYKKSIQICDEIDDLLTMASCYNNIGNIYRIQGNYPRSLENYQKALSLFEETDKEYYAAVCYLNIAILQGVLNNKEEQLEGYLKAAEYFNKVQDNRTLITVYNNIVGTYITANKDSLALSYLEKLIPICESMEDTEKLALSLINYGVVEERFQNYDLAEQKYLEAIALSETIDFVRGNFGAHYSLANYYYTHANYDFALSNVLAAYEEVSEIGTLDEKKSTAELMAKIYEGMNNYKEAYNYYVLFKTFTDSLFNESNVEEITNLKNQYGFDKEKDSIATEQIKKDAIKEAEINHQKTVRNSFIAGFALMIIFALIIFRNSAKIRKVNKQLAIQKLEIQTQAEELEIKNKNLLELSEFKKLMTGTVIHDLKNPLNYIIGTTNDKTIKQSGYNMLHIVLNILDINKAQTTQLKVNLGNHNVDELINEAILQVEYLAEQKNLDFEKIINKEFYIKADKDLTIRILVNILTNAIKYSPLNNKITIQITENNKLAQIDIIDYGKGISEENIDQIFNEYSQIEAKNSGKIKSTGLGLTFCKIATEAQNAKINVSSIPEKKTSFSLIFPLLSISEKETENINTDKTEFLLTIEEQKQLQEILPKLRQTQIFEATEILKLLDSIENSSENIYNWKQKIKIAIYTSNNELFYKLIDNELQNFNN